jgi:hypothetical protein
MSQNNVTSDQAAAIHSLLADALEGSLRQQLMSGEFNPQMIARAMDFLKHNNIQVGTAENKRMQSLAQVLSSVDLTDL